MHSQNNCLKIRTERKQQLVDVTDVVAETVAASGIQTGMVGVYSQHTTAAVLITERQQALTDDILEFLERIVDDTVPYKHNRPDLSDCERRNAASHLRSVLLNHSVIVPVVDGKPMLGQFQSVLLAELDGPRDRTLHVQVLG